MALYLISPTGKRIIGTAESMLAMYPITVNGRKPDGSIDWDYSGGESEDYLDTATQRTDGRGVGLFEDSKGDLWPEDELRVSNEPVRVAAAPTGAGAATPGQPSNVLAVLREVLQEAEAQLQSWPAGEQGNAAHQALQMNGEKYREAVAIAEAAALFIRRTSETALDFTLRGEAAGDPLKLFIAIGNDAQHVLERDHPTTAPATASK